MSWTDTRSLIARTKRDDPDADTSELLEQMRREKAEDDILRLADKACLSEEDRKRVATLLLASVCGDAE